MRALSIIALALVGCASSTAPDPGLEGLALSKVAPGTIIPGTKIVVKGESFVDAQWGTAVLHLQGGNVDVSWPATFVDFGTLNVAVDRGDLDAIGGDVDFHGTATVEYTATSDEQVYKTDPLTLDLSFKKQLMPSVTGVLDGVHFVNDPIEVDGDGFLLGGNEGQTFARLTGCFQPDAGGNCTPITQIDVPMQPLEELSRTKGQWAFLPKIAGIQPGSFTGQVTIVNMQAGGTEVAAPPRDVTYTMVTSQVFDVDPPAASLGQYVFVHGGGFVGGEANALTELELVGTFNKTGGNPAQVSMHLIPDFVDGPLVRYVLNTDDELGHSLDLRKDTGHFTGTMTPIIHYGSDTARGTGAQVTFDIAPVKQVVYLNFEPSYVEELRDFGLRAVDKQIRDRIVAVCNRTYKGVNIEFRTEPVTDFALFENVDLVGVDPNDMGLFGYDNSPGKDNGNVRLYDQLGGVNAVTQQDGYPGYGGVFVRSLMGFSKHPGSFAKAVPGADDNFDKTFDPFRADVDGHPITAADLATGPAVLADGSSCPGKDRPSQISCAIFVMGNLIGGTLAHEIGHSLGLANPYADGFHDAGDAPNRLMDAGGDRPFLERAELQGQGPGVFCDDEYAYLRQIMPSNSPPDHSPRPSCF
ncbi:MAG TPA: hypothetical protein VLT45_21110 [Kofleriaceae bacterium]|nr:hypothetical protein [Kofleriaceae bacterium]